MKLWATEIRTVDQDGNTCLWSGPVVEAYTPLLAQSKLDRDGMGYAVVVGELILEFPADADIPKQAVDISLN